jgi:hypothetical protein
MDMSGQLHDPAALSPVPIGQKAGWAPEPVWSSSKDGYVDFNEKLPLQM